MRRNKLYCSSGLRLLSLPIGKKDSVNTTRKNIADLEMTTAANMISATGIKTNAPMIMCGRYNKIFPVLRQLLRMQQMPYILIGTQKDIEGSCLNDLPTDWSETQIVRSIPQENGRICLRPSAETIYMMKEAMSYWYDHLVVLCLGNGLQIDPDLLNTLNSLGNYIFVTESLSRSIRGSEGCRITTEELLASMDYIIVSSIGTSAKSLMSVLPSYECEKITNTTDFTIHRDSLNPDLDNIHHRNGGGLRFGQARMQESKCIFTQEDLTKMQDNNTMLVYNAKVAHTWVARITR
nr:hypothetical protein [uncultured Blautia sp.]